METDLQVSTQDNIDYVQENSTGHEITQTITNLGPSTVTDLSFTLYSSDCFDTTSVSTSGTATDAGAYSSEAWSGQLQEGQTLILTFTGDITCNAGSNMYFDHPVAVRYNNGANVLEVTHDNNVNANGTAVVYTTDLQIETTDGKASVDAGTTGHEFKQTTIVCIRARPWALVIKLRLIPTGIVIIPNPEPPDVTISPDVFLSLAKPLTG